jgi:hypothetical protein
MRGNGIKKEHSPPLEGGLFLALFYFKKSGGVVQLV